VTGGSLGAAHLNQVLAAALTPLLDAGLQIIHLTGVGKAEPALRQLAKTRPSYQIHEYFENIAVAYQAADLALCRAGAGMVAELSAVGLPSILVPLPHGNGEQMANAQPLSQAGGALVIADQALTAQWLVDQVCKLINDATALPKMAEAAERCGSRNGAERLADLVETVVARGK
jgi:UDP-N-acetylglucosamine--N-acetylmuramyl-(pentapeptide) pyrophosphoryl-undecaprenol N-acetylglucosamine transferase